jgi:hypothetical protein
MLAHFKMIMERDGGYIAINPDKFDKQLIESGSTKPGYFEFQYTP